MDAHEAWQALKISSLWYSRQYRNWELTVGVEWAGAHTMGVAHCANFADRLYPRKDPNMGLLFANTLRARCPRIFPSNAFAALDTSNFRFDNAYYRNVLNRRGLLAIDSALGLDPQTGPVVDNFANNPNAFYNFFASAFIKLTSFNVLLPGQGEVRLNCHTTN